MAHQTETIAEVRQRNNLELALVALVFLFVAFVFVVMILGTINSVDTANKFLPTPAPTPK